MEDIEKLYGLIQNITLLSLVDIPGEISNVIYFKKFLDYNNNEDKNTKGTLIKAKTIVNILNNKKLSNWICFKGEEPLEQIKFILNIIKQLDKRYKIAIYSGYCSKYIFNNYNILLSLDNVKMLKCGPYIRSNIVYNKFLSTKNQELYLKKNNEWNKINWLELDIENLILKLD